VRGLSRQAPPLRAMPLIGALVRAYEEQLTARGRYLLWATGLIGLLGLDTRRAQVFVLFSVAAGALALAWLSARAFRPRARLECALPGRVTALVPLALRASVSSEPVLIRRDLRLLFPRPILPGTGISFSPSEVFLEIDAGASAEARVELRAGRRGKYEVRGPTLRATDPLRLAAGPALALPDQALLVYPRFYTMNQFMVPLGRRYQPGGIPLSSNTGDAIEFVGTREYREGDPVKNIHWRSWARRGEPVVKEYQEEYFCRIAIILDTFLTPKPGPDEIAGFEAAISVVASIADFFSRSEYIVDILAAGPDVYEVSAGRSLAYLENILDVLACLEPCADPPFQTIGPHLFDKLEQITTVVAVLQDWDAPREAFLRQVKSLGTAVRAIIVRSGPTAKPWDGAADELDELSLLTPADVERALAAEPARG
jgi:uncharacterized protein (DUF58 family)